MKSGQAIIFFIMVLVVLVFVVLWNYDLHKILYVKARSQNGGDAAAVAGARWQGISLNLIGDLNLMHALALASGNTAAEGAITSAQARLCFAGPMIGFMAAQQAAKNNGMYRNEKFDRLVLEHANEVRNDYTAPVGPGGSMLFPEPYPGCWGEYADMLTFAATEGIAAGADNARFYSDFTGGHTLLDIGFYNAIAGRDWCWFYNHAPTLLQDYENFFPCWWPPLPILNAPSYMNSEIFSLGLSKVTCDLSDLTDPSVLPALAADRRVSVPAGAGPAGAAGAPRAATWYCYSSFWGPWDVMKPPFPIAGTIKPQYDYAGADAVVRVLTPASRVTPGPTGTVISNTITWTAAAKPFGYLNEEDLPTVCNLVLPAFRDARLIPIDASSAPAGGSFNIEWRDHIQNHLPGYMNDGPGGSSCAYCQQLAMWENPQFRAAGVTWLASNSWRCVASPGGGGGSGPGGGAATGH